MRFAGKPRWTSRQDEDSLISIPVFRIWKVGCMTRDRLRFQWSGLCIVLLCCLACSTIAFAQVKRAPAQAKRYPLQGKIVGSGGHIADGVLYRSFKVETSNKVYSMQCPDKAEDMFSATCGNATLAVGDVIHFRIVGKDAFLSVDSKSEQRMIVAREAPKEASDKEGSNP